jgi:hypothetical protein
VDLKSADRKRLWEFKPTSGHQDSKRAYTSGPQSTTRRNGLASSSPRFPLVNSADFDEVLLNDAATALNPQPRSSFCPQVFQDARAAHPLRLDTIEPPRVLKWRYSALR